MIRPDVLDSIDFDALTREAVELLREYVAIDTTNPPGNVAAAADWWQDALRAHGIDSDRISRTPEKANVVATLPAATAAKPLVIAHHTDVVPAVREEWSVEPFGGVVRDGYIWGRGTQDMKGFGVLSLLCASTLLRLGAPLRRPLRLLATADEEIGGGDGAKWLAEHHFDEVSGEFLLTEGSFARAGSRVTYYPVQVAEKGVSTVKLTARGKAGHASQPRPDNAVVRMARAIARIGDYQSPPHGAAIARRYLAAFPPDALNLKGGRSIDTLSDAEMEALIADLGDSRNIVTMLRNTITPTILSGGLGQNIIPATCEAYLDCRTLPGVTLEDLLVEIAGAIDDPTIEIQLVKSSVGTDSPADTELFEAFRAAVAAERPHALVVPFLTPGGTDCKHFRPKGVVCYGQIPFELSDDEHRLHGIDERVSIANLQLALRILLRTVVRMCL